MSVGGILEVYYSSSLRPIEYSNDNDIFTANKVLTSIYSNIISDGFRTGTGDNLQAFILNTPTQLFYNTVYFDPTFFNLGNIASSRVEEIIVWNAYLKPISLSNINYDNSQGVIIDLPTNKNFDALELKILKMHVNRDGSPLVDISAQFMFSNGFKFVMPITGSRTLIVAYIPDQSFIETLEYKTEISQSIRKEMRAKMYSAPIRKYSYKYMLDEEMLSHFSNLFTDAQSKQYLVPTWQEMMLLPNGINTGENVFTINEELRGFEEKAQVILWENPFKVFATSIKKREGNTITLKDLPPQRYGRCFLIPCVLSTIQSQVDISRDYYNNVFRANIAFTQNNSNLENKKLNLPLLENEPVFTIPYSKGDMSSLQKATFITDTFAKPFVHIEQDKGLFKLKASVIRNSLKEYHEWLDFLNFCSGRFKAFWLPTRFNDLRLAAVAETNQGFLELEHNVSYDSRNAVMISYEGQQFYSKIKGNIIQNGRTRLILKDNMPFKIDKTKPYRISLMYRVRLEDDEQTIEHESYYNKSISFGATEIL